MVSSIDPQNYKEFRSSRYLWGEAAESLSSKYVKNAYNIVVVSNNKSCPIIKMQYWLDEANEEELEGDDGIGFK